MNLEKLRIDLQKVGLKGTKTRLAVLHLFRSFEFALSYQDIQEKLAEKEDKATIYRTLKSFIGAGIIHEIIGKDRVLRYASCASECTTQEHKDSHAHFHCEKCSSIYCIKTPKIELELPLNFSARNYVLNVEGVCQKCA